MRPFKLFIRQIIAAKDIVLYAKNITALIQHGDTKNLAPLIGLTKTVKTASVEAAAEDILFARKL